MDDTSKVVVFLSQVAALSVVLTFVVGMRWQSGFYEGLGFPWLSGYSNYLDTIRFGVPHTLTLGLAAASGWFVTWIIYHQKKDLVPVLFFSTIVLIPMGEMFSSFFYDPTSTAYLRLMSFYQIILTGFFIGCVFCAPPRWSIVKGEGGESLRAFQIVVLLFVSVIMIAFFASPYQLGKAAAQEAISTGFRDNALVTNSNSEYWNLVGYSQGNMILARIVTAKNQVQVKVANNISDWIVFPTDPKATGITSTP